MPRNRFLNWLFPAPRPHHSPVEERDTPTPTLDARLREIESQLRDLALVRIEWTEVLDKLQAWTNRQNARDAKRLRTGLDRMAETHEDAPEAPIPAGVPLDPHQLKQSLRAKLRAQNGGRS